MGYGYGYGLDPTFILLIPAIIFSLYAQFRVKNTFGRYANVRNSYGLTGAEAARRVLDSNGLTDVQIVPVAGSLTDHYDPRNRTVNLSETVYGQTTVSAVSVACHEVGHAIQHANGYMPLKIRSSFAPVASFASNIAWVLILVGIMLLAAGDSLSGSGIGNLIFNIGVIAFVCVVFFHLITLPVEFNASRRALAQMEGMGIVSDEDLAGSKKVLRAAALTYVAAMAVAVANLLRILALRNRN